jgi:hypothetical protein
LLKGNLFPSQGSLLFYSKNELHLYLDAHREREERTKDKSRVKREDKEKSRVKREDKE